MESLNTDGRETVKCLKALANARRVRILQELLRAPSLTVGDIASRIKLSYKSTSKHVLKLAECDLVERDQRSLEVYCSINRRHPIIRALQPYFKR